jgi:hypothetical protein
LMIANCMFFFHLHNFNMVGYQVSSYGIQLDNKYAGFFNLKLL